MDRRLFQICSSRDQDSKEQRRLIVRALELGANVNETDKNGVTALHFAVRFRSVEAVKALIEYGANVNHACNRNKSTPLHRAVTQTGAPGTSGKSESAREIIRMLLAAGADTALTNKLGKRPADYVKDPSLASLFP